MLTGGAILCYHALTADATPSESPVNVPVDEFKSTVGTLARFGTAVPLSEMVARHRAGRSTRGLLSVTFDDAYLTVAQLAGDWLAANGIPVCIFVVSGACDTGRRFWWDRIEDLAPRASDADWQRFIDALGVPQAYRDGHGASGRFRPVRQWLLAEHQGRFPEGAEGALQALESAGTTSQRAMDWDELLAFSSRAPVEWGVHTVSHPVLPLLPDDTLRREVADAHAVLRERLPRVIPMLACPYGHHDARTARIAGEAGMTASFSVANRALRAADQGVLPRVGITRRMSAMRTLARAENVGALLGRGGTVDPPVLPSATT